MEEFAVIIVRGLGLGAVFALVAMSLNAVHRASGIFNFAQGAMMVLGGIIAARYMPNVPDPYRWFLFLPVATIALAVDHDGAGLHHAAAAALLGRAALLARLHPRGLGADRRGHPAAAGQHARSSRPASSRAFRLSARARRRRTCMAIVLALVWYVALHWFHRAHAHRPVDQRGRAGSRRRARGRPARATAADARVRHQRR